MKKTTTLHSTKVKNLITKFYYRDNHLCFQILLNCKDGRKVVYREYTDYAEYKSEYDQLLAAKANDQGIIVPQRGVQTTHVSFV